MELKFKPKEVPDYRYKIEKIKGAFPGVAGITNDMIVPSFELFSGHDAAIAIYTQYAWRDTNKLICDREQFIGFIGACLKKLIEEFIPIYDILGMRTIRSILMFGANKTKELLSNKYNISDDVINAISPIYESRGGLIDSRFYNNDIYLSVLSYVNLMVCMDSILKNIDESIDIINSTYNEMSEAGEYPNTTNNFMCIADDIDFNKLFNDEELKEDAEFRFIKSTGFLLARVGDNELDLIEFAVLLHCFPVNIPMKIDSLLGIVYNLMGREDIKSYGNIDSYRWH